MPTFKSHCEYFSPSRFKPSPYFTVHPRFSPSPSSTFHKAPFNQQLTDISQTYDAGKETQVECIMQALATDVGALYKNLAPKAYSNQVSNTGYLDNWEGCDLRLSPLMLNICDYNLFIIPT